MSLIRKHVAVLQAWACLAIVRWRQICGWRPCSVSLVFIIAIVCTVVVIT